MGGLVGAMLCLAGQPCFQVTIAPTPSSFPISPSWVASKMLLEYPGNANLARYLIVSRATIIQIKTPNRGISVVNKHRMIYHTPQTAGRDFVFLHQFFSRLVLVLVGLPHLSLALPASQDPCFQVANLLTLTQHFQLRTLITLRTVGALSKRNFVKTR